MAKPPAVSRPSHSPRGLFGSLWAKTDRLPGQSKPDVPRPLSAKELPRKYKDAERRVRTAIIALPIALVTSWVLWKRLVQGEERRKLAIPSQSNSKGNEVGR
ncbi:hypothetical protein BDZ91DRAFT_716532 [Kalaharituber pfeilii]|nr:hypothetical protein BDZ91DRAFT_716532 [Kalaharituber pfeilii]